MRVRWLVIVLVLPVYTFGLMLVATTAVVLVAADGWSERHPRAIAAALRAAAADSEWWARLGAAAVVAVAAQAVFLIPVLARRPPRETRGRSLTLSVLMVVLLGGLVAGILGLGVMEIVALAVLPERSFDEKEGLWLVPVVFVVAGWAAWSAALLLFSREIWADRLLGRAVGLLLGGTILELLVVVPVDVMVRRRAQCYCGTGTFFALLLATAVTLWLAGPGIVIALTSRRHRLWRETHCLRCGYPYGPGGPGTGDRCPECGWRRGARAAAPPPAKGD